MRETTPPKSTSRRGLLAAGLAATVITVMGAAIAAPALARPDTGVVRSAAGTAVPDSYIVVLRDTAATDAPSLAAAANRLILRYGGTVGHVYGAALNGFEVRMPEQAARRLAADPAVAYVEQDQVVSLPAVTQTPSPATTGVQQNPPSWGLDRVDQRYLPLNQQYAYLDTAPSVRAYVLDSGIRRTHVDFSGRVEAGYDVIDALPADDCHGHGTAMAGVIGGRLHGLAKDVRLVPVRVLNCQGSATYSQIIAGVNWVTANAVRPAVALMALGGSPNTSLEAAVTNSINSGISYVVAAGSSGGDACTTSPARIGPALTVTASTSTDARASFGNYGSCVDLFAPGVNITTTWFTSDTATYVYAGTAIASAHVAGCAALVRSVHPTWTPAQVHAHLVNTATAGIVTGVPAGTPNRLLYCTYY